MSDRKIHACVERKLPRELVTAAAERAIAETPANEPAVERRAGVAPPSRFDLAAVTGKKWQNGRSLRVSFLDGDSAVQQKLQPFAHQWSEFANVTLQFGSESRAEIRISFRDAGSWSYIGTDALSIPAGQPTMNFGWLTPTTSNEEYSRVVIHEFGHALGCIHEHQNPSGGIPWDKDAVYRYYMGPPNNWSREEVDVNLFQTYDASITQFSAFDPSSIMCYPIPNGFTIGDFEVGWNTQLSQTDKQFVASLYPRATDNATLLTVGAPPTEAAIARRGEEDLYRFAAASDGRYTIETRGSTDVVMSLLGPDSQTRVIAEDDDSGVGWNARIQARLSRGTYYVRIRHHRSTGTGRYAISVRAEQ